jgi:hypothetical protein
MTVGALDLLHEARVMFGNDGVKCGLFWPMPVIGGREGKSRLGEHRA